MPVPRYSLRVERSLFLQEYLPCPAQLVQRADHREHHLEVAVNRRPEDGPDLCAEELLQLNRQPQPAYPEKGVLLPRQFEPRNLFVASDIHGPKYHRLFTERLEYLAVNDILLVLSRQMLTVKVEKFGAEKPAAVGICRL